MVNAITETGTSCKERGRECCVFEFVCGPGWLGRLPEGEAQGSSVCARLIPGPLLYSRYHLTVALRTPGGLGDSKT